MTYFINTTMMDTIKNGLTPLRAPQPVTGETWYVKLPDTKNLTTVVVSDVTAHTVELTGDGGFRHRYIREDVCFVERVYQP